MKALITGFGFIGKQLAKNLKQNGYEVAILGRTPPEEKSYRFINCDIRDKKKIIESARGHDFIFHLAGVLGTDYLTEGGLERIEESISININGSLHIFEAARKNNSTVINAGLVPNWANPYMITKKAAAKFGEMYFNEFGTDIRTLELSHVYGPGQKDKPVKKVIPCFILSALQNKPLTIFGKGTNKMDCIYVDDAAEAFRLAAENKKMKGAVASVGTGREITVLELAKKVIKLANSSSKLIFKEMRAGEPDKHDDYSSLNLSNWKKFNKWLPSTTLEQGLENTIEWYRKNL